MLGIKTIGNATMIVYDELPVLVTDPWFGDEDDAFFGSWTLSHEIPASEKADILDAKWVWFSHGHQDHLNPKSIERLRHSLILLPDHIGGRIKADLEARGFKVSVLPDARWVRLSKRVRILCVSDYLQDAVLLVDVGGRLFIDMNDCDAKARLRLIAGIVREYAHSYLLRLSGYGDAGMINVFDLDGNRIEPQLNREVGLWLSHYARRLSAKNVIPFSSFHRYQREDSAWANAYTTPLFAYREGFDEDIANYIAPFTWIDGGSGQVVALAPRELPRILRTPEECGDSWSDELTAEDKKMLYAYFRRKEALNELLGFVTFIVGGKSYTIDFAGPRDRGITFQAPRNSLIAAATHRVFDDLSAGNFMKTTLHNLESFYAANSSLHAQNFDFVVGKYADNGGAETREALRAYFSEYRKRAGTVDWVVHRVLAGGQAVFRRHVPKDARVYRLAQGIYRSMLRT